MKGSVGEWKLRWLSPPHGDNGSAYVDVEGKGRIEVRWNRDAQGIWVDVLGEVRGYDLDGEITESGQTVFRVHRRGTSEHWEGLSYVRAGDEKALEGAGQARKAVKVRAQMPGKVIRVHVKEGDHVAQDQPLLVMEAMKMENEIRARHGGVVKTVRVSPGMAVETGAELMVME